MSIWNIPELRARTEAASKLPKGDLPEVGTVVHLDKWVVAVTQAAFDQFSGIDAGGCRHNSYSQLWRYATPSEIDQFERDSALPNIVDPIEAEIASIYFDWHSGKTEGVERTIRTAINRGIEIERARKAGA